MNCCNGDCQQGRRCPYKQPCRLRAADLAIAVALVAIVIAVTFVISHL